MVNFILVTLTKTRTIANIKSFGGCSRNLHRGRVEKYYRKILSDFASSSDSNNLGRYQNTIAFPSIIDSNYFTFLSF